MNITPIAEIIHESHPGEIVKNSIELEIEDLNVHSMGPPDCCLLLGLPTEIRSMILEYVLPTTFVSERRQLCRRTGTTNLLAVSK